MVETEAEERRRDYIQTVYLVGDGELMKRLGHE